jgi:hypothetical protein
MVFAHQAVKMGNTTLERGGFCGSSRNQIAQGAAGNRNEFER